MKYKYLLFDLDGTLWDSREGITKAVAYALEKMGYPVPEQQELSKFIGPPLTEAFPEYCGMTLEEARQGVAYFRSPIISALVFHSSSVSPILLNSSSITFGFPHRLSSRDPPQI